MKLRENIISRLDTVTKSNENIELTTYNIVDYMPSDSGDYVGDVKWSKCKVGSLEGLKVDDNVRYNTFERKAEPKFEMYPNGYCMGGSGYDRETEKSAMELLAKLYPKAILDAHNSQYDRLHELLIPHLTYCFVGGYRSRYLYHNNEYTGASSSISLLLYKKGGFFKEHSDTPVKRKFATTLVMIPTKGLVGGDLVLRVLQEDVYDPDGILVRDGDRVRLKVDQLTTPVLISFCVKIPHEVEVVQEGYRLCLKM
jgi:hypothetical protein